MKYKKNNLLFLFWSLVGIALVVAGEFFIPVVRDIFKGSLLFLLPIAIFCLLGAALIFVTLKGKVKGVLKKFLMLTGISSAGFFVSIFLHNIFYALAVVTSKIVVLSYLAGIFSILFFFVSIFACPLGFLVGATGVIIILLKKK